ncbi:MAG TPA: flagellar hook-basal body complex protein FliE [Pseudolabrys sp.]|jgi:flagellar hook-basal body complex protein FliE
MATPITAANAYANVARLTDASLSLGKDGGADKPSGTSFTSVLKEALGAVNDMGRKSDAQTRAAANGKANMVDVVTAVSETQVAIDAVVAVRDRVIQAYEDIMKMPI